MTTSGLSHRHPTSEQNHAPTTPAQQETGETIRQTHVDPRHERAIQPPRSNLRLPSAPLIGREQAAVTIQHLLLQEAISLLTLIGPGGIGKTRLALEVAAQLLDHFVDGVYFVSLAPISDPKLVSVALAQTVGVREAAGS